MANALPNGLEPPEYYVTRAGDSQLINDLVKRLRSTPEEDALNYVLNCFQDYRGFALRLAGRCLRKRQSLERILTECIRSRSPGIMPECLRMLKPRIGLARTIDVLIEEVDQYPSQVALARYNLGTSRQPEIQERLSRLASALAEARAQQQPPGDIDAPSAE